jgi:hypothetical protein
MTDAVDSVELGLGTDQIHAIGSRGSTSGAPTKDEESMICAIMEWFGKMQGGKAQHPPPPPAIDVSTSASPTDGACARYIRDPSICRTLPLSYQQGLDKHHIIINLVIRFTPAWA